MADANSNRHEKLHTYFERSAAAVTQSFDRLDRNFIQPGITLVAVSFVERPIRTAFLSTFAALSLLPVLSFVGFSIFAVGACTFFALAAALVVSSAAIAFVGFWLGVTLTILLFVSLFLTSAVISTYLFFRYVTLVRTDGPRDGSVQWAREVRRRVRGARQEATHEGKPHSEEVDSAKQDPAADDQAKVEMQDDLKSEGSVVDDATVFIGEDSPDRRDSYKEMDGRDSPVFVKREMEPGVTTVEVTPPNGQVVDAF
ncbi:hypothetical protein BXZ70DRAFT_931849 [Cristinia sonorae]|uniref:Promethin n=1 Tax=Cristinia sonorae TaxID=1940300 RepID=A0A8K0USQ9_9AGAR|nr:hypothetical protein BXZ70DRAFT_931849 [Cristinia sonorae]